MKSIFVTRKPRKCHRCGRQAVVKILYGEPNEEAEVLSKEGKLVLGGCIVIEQNPDWACTHCETEYKKMRTPKL